MNPAESEKLPILCTVICQDINARSIETHEAEEDQSLEGAQERSSLTCKTPANLALSSDMLRKVVFAPIDPWFSTRAAAGG